MKKTLPVTIGTTEFISLPDDELFGIPAKIDTGADGSAIWASNIHLEDDKLVFNFFAPGSAYYRETPVVSDAYRIASVKNSFGQSEFRYKIRLKVTVGDHTVTRWFSLADRSRNHYPVLLGKNFLKNRFLVDVAAHYLFTPKDKVASNSLITVVSSRTDDEVQDFFKAVEDSLKVDCKIDLVHYDDLAFWFGEKPQVINLQTGQSLDNSKILYIKNYKRYPEQAVALAQYGSYRNIVVRDEELVDVVSMSKLSETMRLNCYDLPVPTGVAMCTEQMIKNVDDVIQKIGLPLVLKDIHSDRGKNNYYLETKAELLDILNAAETECYFLAQQFIPNKGFTRVVVLGKEAAFAVQRTETSHEHSNKQHLNKPAGGANATVLEPSETESQANSLAVNAAEIMGRQVAGVDVIQDSKTQKWYILEVNYNPEMITGSFTDRKVEAFATFIKQELGRW